MPRKEASDPEREEASPDPSEGRGVLLDEEYSPCLSSPERIGALPLSGEPYLLKICNNFLAYPPLN